MDIMPKGFLDQTRLEIGATSTVTSSLSWRKEADLAACRSEVRDIVLSRVLCRVSSRGISRVSTAELDSVSFYCCLCLPLPILIDHVDLAAHLQRAAIEGHEHGKSEKRDGHNDDGNLWAFRGVCAIAVSQPGSLVQGRLVNVRVGAIAIWYIAHLDSRPSSICLELSAVLVRMQT